MRPTLSLRGGCAVWLACAWLWSTPADVGARTLALPSAEATVIGSVTTVTARHEDTLSDIARAHEVGYAKIVAANPGVDPWLPGEGTPVVLPTRYILPDAPRAGMVLNLPEYRLYHYRAHKPGEPDGVAIYPVSIGDMDWRTPLGLTRVVSTVRAVIAATQSRPATIDWDAVERAARERRGLPVPVSR